MILVGNSVVSDDIKDTMFACDLSKCKGACCVDGDAGAPLLKEEIEIIEKHLPKINKYLLDAAKSVIDKQGFYEYDFEGELCTKIYNNNRECVFVIYEDGIASCAIEKAYHKGAIDFIKPISCHLYPIRVKDYGDFKALNYHRWSVCDSALIRGRHEGIPMYKFLKEPLIRSFGQEWYDDLLSQIE